MLMKGTHGVGELDQDLIQRCQQGSVGAWHQVLNRYERLVYSIPLRYGLSRDDAADVAQYTFTVLVQNIDNLAEDSRLGAWLSTVARRNSWHLLERNRREIASKHLEGVSLAESAVLFRELLLALYFQPESLSYAEVAERLGMPLGSIGPTRARCLKRLKQVLGEG
jgi:DNA-directed RNA polymerase specialized sigma24 family protein